MKKLRYVVGVDEVGRGPIAGPVAVGALLIDTEDGELMKELKRLFPIVKDSKMLSEKRREEIVDIIKELSLKRGSLSCAVCLISSSIIDRKGIVFAINQSLDRSLEKVVKDPANSFIMLDGGLTAPSHFTYQESYIRGDATHLPIALASIVAKVARDHYMVGLAKRYPGYGFERHKGYGTKEHYEAIGRLGITSIHRKSFLKGLI